MARRSKDRARRDRKARAQQDPYYHYNQGAAGLPPQYPSSGQPSWQPGQYPSYPGHNDEEKPVDEILRRIGLGGWGALILIPCFLLLAVFLTIVFIGRPYSVNGTSMMETLHDGDRVFVIPYRGKTTPNRGDIVVIKKAPGTDELLIKRVIALAGDRVTLQKNQVVVNDKFFHKSTNHSYSKGDESFLVPDGCLYVMGDNQAHSYDSRAFGPIQADKIVGKAVLRFWPLTEFKKL